MRIALIGTSLSLDMAGHEIVKVPVKTSKDYSGTHEVYDQVSLQDFHFVVVNFSEIKLGDNGWIRQALEAGGSGFVSNGGVLMFSNFKSHTWNTIREFKGKEGRMERRSVEENFLSWIPGDAIEILPGSGSRVYLERSHPIVKQLEDKHFSWEMAFKAPPAARILGRNANGQAVGFEVSIGRGIFLILPHVLASSQSAKDRVSAVVQYLQTRGAAPLTRHPPPAWAENYLLPEEGALRKRVEEDRSSLDSYETIRAMLYGDGATLLDAVIAALRTIGFDVRNVERLGKHDLEFSEASIVAIVEVTGTKDALSVRGLRELSDHYLDAVSAAEEARLEVRHKGIFVVNHFKDVEPPSRGAALTEHALRIAKREGFAVVPTTTLYALLSRFLKGVMTREHVGSLLFETEGVVALPREDST